MRGREGEDQTKLIAERFFRNFPAFPSKLDDAKSKNFSSEGTI